MTRYSSTMSEAYEKVIYRDSISERDLTDAEEKRREEIAKDLPDQEFKDRYGARWKSVKMATATKMVKNESLEEAREKPARQLLNPNREEMVVKKNTVIVIDKKELDKYLKRGWELAEEVELKEMNPTDHVKKKGDKFCVYNADGTIAKEFDNREDAEKYAIANHDKLMATKKEEVEIDEGTKYIGRAGEGTQFQVVYTNKKRRDGIYRLERDRTLGKIYNQREAEKMVKKLSADKRNSDFEYRFVPKGNINHRSGEVVTPVDFYKVCFKNRREQVTSPSKYIDILTKFQEETEYQKFFKSAMKKFGVKSPSELDGDKEYVDRLKEELLVINERGFAKYFLTM